MNYPFHSKPLTAGTHRLVGPACQRYENRGAALLDADRPEFADGELFRRRHRHNSDHYDLPHLMSYQAGPNAGAKHDGGVNGGASVRINGETLEVTVIVRSTAT